MYDTLTFIIHKKREIIVCLQEVNILVVGLNGYRTGKLSG